MPFLFVVPINLNSHKMGNRSIEVGISIMICINLISKVM